MRKLLFILIIVLGFFSINYYLQNPLTVKVIINSTVIPVEIAVTATEKQRGLGGRGRLNVGHGMLFVYDHSEVYPFWMKDMRFPLDFVWIKGNQVVDITANVPISQNSNLKIYHPKEPVDKILELNAGEVANFDLKIGDKVEFITN